MASSAGSSSFAVPNLKMAATMNTNVPPNASNEAPASAPPPVPFTSILGRLVRPEDAIEYVTVADPVIHADGINKYTSYRVDCRPPALSGDAPPNPMDIFLQQNQGQYSAVLRRYSDFLWLYERLHRERAGAIVPPLPEKQAVSRFSPEFVEDRRVNLERFLRRLIIHPELFDAPSLLTFLRADDHAFQHAKTVAESTDKAAAGGMGGSQMGLGGAGAFNLSPKKAEGIKKWFSEAKTFMSGDLVRSPDDDLFDEIERYIECLNVQMKRVSSQATGLVRKGKEVANGMFEFGLAFQQLGLSEGEGLGSKLQVVGATADSLSAMVADQADKELRRLEEPLRDYIKIIHAVKLALARRHEKRVSYTALLHEIETREVQLHRLRMTPGSEGKAYSTEMSLQRYRQGAEAAGEEYTEVCQRVLREVDRFKREKAEEMRLVVLEFIVLQIEVHRRMERVWGELVPKLEGDLEGTNATQTDGFESSGGMWGDSGVGSSVGGQAPSMPPSQPPPPPTPFMPSQPMYSNVPSPSFMPMGGSADPLMESSIQYRDNNNLAGLGL